MIRILYWIKHFIYYKFNEWGYKIEILFRQCKKNLNYKLMKNKLKKYENRKCFDT